MKLRDRRGPSWRRAPVAAGSERQRQMGRVCSPLRTRPAPGSLFLFFQIDDPYVKERLEIPSSPNESPKSGHETEVESLEKTHKLVASRRHHDDEVDVRGRAARVSNGTPVDVHAAEYGPREIRDVRSIPSQCRSGSCCEPADPPLRDAGGRHPAGIHASSSRQQPPARRGGRSTHLLR